VAEWQGRFDLSHGEFGRLYMFATLASALCLPFVGKRVDDVRAHHMIAFVIPVLAGAAVMAGFATSLPALIVGIFLLRLFGQGMMTHVALTSTGRWFVAARGRAVSLVVLGHQGGEATVPLAFAAVTIAFGYQAGWLAAAAALLVIGLPCVWWCYRVPRVPHGQVSTETSLKPAVRDWTRAEVLTDPMYWVLLVGVLAPPFIGTTIFYQQNYLTALHDWPPTLFAQSLILLAVTTVTCALLTGAVIDRFGAIRVLPFFLLPLAAACFVAGVSGSPPMLFVMMVLLGISYGIASTLFGSLWPEIYGVLHLGSVRSVTMSAAVMATAAGPGVTGTLIDMGVSLPVQMLFLSGYCLLAAGVMAVAAVFLRRRV